MQSDVVVYCFWTNLFIQTSYLSNPLEPDVGLLPKMLCARLYVSTPLCAKTRVVCKVKCTARARPSSAAIPRNIYFNTRMLRCNSLLQERQVGVFHWDAPPIYHDKPVGLLAQGISQRALLRVEGFALRPTDPRA